MHGKFFHHLRWVLEVCVDTCFMNSFVAGLCWVHFSAFTAGSLEVVDKQRISVTLSSFPDESITWEHVSKDTAAEPVILLIFFETLH